MNPIYKKISFVFAIIIGIIIFYVSSIPYLRNPVPGFSLIPFIYHFCIFFLFSFFLLFSLDFKKELIITALLICFLYALLDEIHQFFVLGRVCGFFDIFTDFSGNSFAFFLRWMFRGI